MELPGHTQRSQARSSVTYKMVGLFQSRVALATRVFRGDSHCASGALQLTSFLLAEAPSHGEEQGNRLPLTDYTCNSRRNALFASRPFWGTPLK